MAKQSLIIGKVKHVENLQHYSGESSDYDIDWNVEVGRLGTTVSTSSWAVESGSATITGESLASNIASATITTGSEGCSLIKVAVTYADSQVDIKYFKVKAQDPTCGQSASNRY